MPLIDELESHAHAYLDRIGYHGPLESTATVLRALHRAHLYSVPFENLDIAIGREIICDQARFLHKIIKEKRGGFCYELNGAFAALLRSLGFKVILLSARVSGEGGNYGPEFDHLALRVDLEEPWLADVGFGDSFIDPLRLEPNIEQEQLGRVYRLTFDGAIIHYQMNVSGVWKNQYCFENRPRELSEFVAMCRYNQTSPQSTFTRKRICSRATPEGRITLSNGKLIETRNGARQERALNDEEWTASLRELFGVVLPRPANADH